jgi:hypothetical protein
VARDLAVANATESVANATQAEAPAGMPEAAKSIPPENIGPDYGDSWGANLEADEAANLAKVRAEIQVQRNKRAKRKPETLTPAAREMERETFRRLPEQVGARGDPPALSSVPLLKAQGDVCATRGVDYLEAFWANLTREERVSVGGKAALDAWQRTAREVDAAPKAPESSRPATVPEVYLDAWATLQARKPGEVTEAQWKQAIEDAGRFLVGDRAKDAANSDWTVRDLFDPPIMGVPPGLVWFLRGRPVSSIGPQFAGVGEGYVVFNKENRQTWQNPHNTSCAEIGL